MLSANRARGNNAPRPRLFEKYKAEMISRLSCSDELALFASLAISGLAISEEVVLIVTLTWDPAAADGEMLVVTSVESAKFAGEGISADSGLIGSNMFQLACKDFEKVNCERHVGVMCTFMFNMKRAGEEEPTSGDGYGSMVHSVRPFARAMWEDGDWQKCFASITLLSTYTTVTLADLGCSPGQMNEKYAKQLHLGSRSGEFHAPELRRFMNLENKRRELEAMRTRKVQSLNFIQLLLYRLATLQYLCHIVARGLVPRSRPYILHLSPNGPTSASPSLPVGPTLSPGLIELFHPHQAPNQHRRAAGRSLAAVAGASRVMGGV